MALQLLNGYESPDEDYEELVRLSKRQMAQEDEIGKDVEYVVNCMVNTVVQKERSSRLRDILDKPKGLYRTTENNDEIILTDETDTESSSSSSDSSFDSDYEDEGLMAAIRQPKPYSGPKTKGELGFDDLPPIQDLSIHCPTDSLNHVGRVEAIVERVVTVQSFKNQPPLNFDSILFMKNGEPLGQVFDIFGPVKEPRYVIRFNHEDDIKAKGITREMPVYFAPNMKPFTSYVFTKDLMSEKGSDASWKHNNEPPEEAKDYSDDDEEKKSKQRKMKRKKN